MQFSFLAMADAPSIMNSGPATGRGLLSKERKAKKASSSCVRLPCLARGMCKAHNGKSAYLVIPSNVQHGDELGCSFSSCSAQFRYCATCKKPVAKRNFRNRHAHSKCTKAKSVNKTPEEDAPEEDAASSSPSSFSGEDYVTPGSTDALGHLQLSMTYMSMPPPPKRNKTMMDPSRYAGIADVICFPALSGEGGQFNLRPHFLIPTNIQLCK